MANGVPTCSYVTDPSITVDMKVVPMVFSQSNAAAPSYTSLPNKTIYEEELNRFQQALAIANGKVSKEKKLTDSFKALQDAENVRDTAPDAYETARINYYTAKEGDKAGAWMEQEVSRIAAVEATPIVTQYEGIYQDLDRRMTAQKTTIDMVNSIRDKLLTVQDDLAFSVSAFSRQMKDIKNQIHMNRKKQTEAAQSAFPWWDILMNILIVVVAIVAIVAVASYIFRTPAANSPGTNYR